MFKLWPIEALTLPKLMKGIAALVKSLNTNETPADFESIKLSSGSVDV